MTPEPLFDPTPYETGRPRAARVKTAPPEVPIEDLLPGWTYMRDRKGVIPYAHMIQSRNSWGTSIARCGAVGTTITNSGVEVMRRCQLCDADRQLSE